MRKIKVECIKCSREIEVNLKYYKTKKEYKCKKCQVKQMVETEMDLMSGQRMQEVTYLSQSGVEKCLPNLEKELVRD